MAGIDIQLVSSVNAKNPIIIFPEDHDHPFNKVVRNDALIIEVDYSKMPKEEDEGEDDE